jgi:hypothetical protein
MDATVRGRLTSNGNERDKTQHGQATVARFSYGQPDRPVQHHGAVVGDGVQRAASAPASTRCRCQVPLPRG